MEAQPLEALKLSSDSFGKIPKKSFLGKEIFET